MSPLLSKLSCLELRSVCVCVYVELLSVCDGARRVAPWAPAALTALPQLHSGETDVVAAA